MQLVAIHGEEQSNEHIIPSDSVLYCTLCFTLNWLQIVELIHLDVHIENEFILT